MTLHDQLFGERGIPALELAPGIATPRRFTDPRVEHTATRQTVGLFDFSFMACFAIEGPESTAFLERLQARRVRDMRAGRIRYTLLCRDDGSVLNDATVWCRGEARYTLFTGRRADVAHLQEHARGYEVAIRDESQERAALAVQGPLALRALHAAFPGEAWEGLPYFGFRTVAFDGTPCDVARLGYTGEAGFEAIVPSAHAAALWHRLASAGAELGLAECGFEAADALRVEAGFILFARELARRVTPYELGLGRLVDARGEGFIGERALSRLRWREPAQRLVGLVLDARAAEAEARSDSDDAPAPGHALLTSAATSPLYERRLGLGFVAFEDRHAGTRVALERAGRATVARLPFYDPMKRRPRRDWVMSAAACAV